VKTILKCASEIRHLLWFIWPKW